MKKNSKHESWTQKAVFQIGEVMYVRESNLRTSSYRNGNIVLDISSLQLT